MFARIAEIQPLFLGLTLLWAGGYKLTGGAVGAASARSALATLLGRGRARNAYLALGGAELALATALLLPPVLIWEAWLSALLGLGFVGFLGYARVKAPQSSCGCMSSDSGPVTWRGIARGGLVLVAALIAGFASGHWIGAFGSDPVGSAAVLAVEAALLLALSPDLDLKRRRLTGKLRALIWPHPLAQSAAEAPLAIAVAQLHQSEIFQANEWLLRSDIQDAWKADDWFILSYAGRLGHGLDSEPVSVVFAVPSHHAPDTVRMSIVDQHGADVPAPDRPTLATTSPRS